MAHENFELGTCLERVRGRDEDAARDLVEHLHPLVSRLVRAHLPHGDDERDLIQDVFVKIFTRLEQFRGGVPFEHWVSRVAVSTCLDRLRAHKRRPLVRWSDLSEEQQAVLDTMVPEDSENNREDRLAWELLEKLLAALDPKDRLLMNLLEMEQKSIAEVCALTGWNSGVVRIRAFRARQKLKTLYRRLEESRT